MGVERVMLEHHRHVALGRRVAQHRLASDPDVARIGPVQARDQAQRGGLARAGRAEQDDKGTVGDRHGHAVQRPRGAKGL